MTENTPRGGAGGLRMIATVIVSCVIAVCAAAAVVAAVRMRKKRRGKCSGCPYGCSGKDCRKDMKDKRG